MLNISFLIENHECLRSLDRVCWMRILYRSDSLRVVRGLPWLATEMSG
jgi:hypothetical protein